MIRSLPSTMTTSPLSTLTSLVDAPWVVAVSFSTCALILTAKTRLIAPTASSVPTLDQLPFEFIVFAPFEPSELRNRIQMSRLCRHPPSMHGLCNAEVRPQRSKKDNVGSLHMSISSTMHE